ncbi:BrnT family toxin [Paracoccus litorisediminis]|nr:BrnT family toxin [Paracoccus litorisediminis]
MKLEWDETKRSNTLQERGLDFASVADAEWDAALTVEDDRADYGEARFISLVPIQDRLCVVAWCVRSDTLRVISLRKANDRERRRYEQDQTPDRR